MGSSDFRLVSDETTTQLTVRRYVVKCPYPVGSKAWEPSVVHVDGVRPGDAEGTRDDHHEPVRIQVPRVLESELFGAVARREVALNDRLANVFHATWVNGFGQHLPEGCRSATEIQIVHVEYQCTDGAEHVFVPMPLSWDPRIALGVKVQTEIADDAA